MSLLTVFFMSFGLIFVAELGDKTQLMVFTLALRYGGKPVLGGAFLAFALLSGSAAVIGKGLGELFSPDLITRVSAWTFILFGGYMLLSKKEDAEHKSAGPSAGTGFFTAFSMLAISEMGDKTQVGTLLLAVKYQTFFPVFLGSLFALSLVSLISILIAGKIHKFIPQRYVSPLAGILFIVLGAATLLLS